MRRFVKQFHHGVESSIYHVYENDGKLPIGVFVYLYDTHLDKGDHVLFTSEEVDAARLLGLTRAGLDFSESLEG
jgi:hypothetical protein